MYYIETIEKKHAQYGVLLMGILEPHSVRDETTESSDVDSHEKKLLFLFSSINIEIVKQQMW